MTREEAQKVLDLKNAEYDAFCPIIKGACRKDCTCYQEGVILQRHGQPENYFVSDPGCVNVAIIGKG